MKSANVERGRSAGRGKEDAQKRAAAGRLGLRHTTGHEGGGSSYKGSDVVAYIARPCRAQFFKSDVVACVEGARRFFKPRQVSSENQHNASSRLLGFAVFVAA